MMQSSESDDDEEDSSPLLLSTISTTWVKVNIHAYRAHEHHQNQMDPVEPDATATFSVNIVVKMKYYLSPIAQNFQKVTNIKIKK